MEFQLDDFRDSGDPVGDSQPALQRLCSRLGRMHDGRSDEQTIVKLGTGQIKLIGQTRGGDWWPWLETHGAGQKDSIASVQCMPLRNVRFEGEGIGLTEVIVESPTAHALFNIHTAGVPVYNLVFDPNTAFYDPAFMIRVDPVEPGTRRMKLQGDQAQFFNVGDVFFMFGTFVWMGQTAKVVDVQPPYIFVEDPWVWAFNERRIEIMADAPLGATQLLIRNERLTWDHRLPTRKQVRINGHDTGIAGTGAHWIDIADPLPGPVSKGDWIELTPDDGWEYNTVWPPALCKKLFQELRRSDNQQLVWNTPDDDAEALSTFPENIEFAEMSLVCDRIVAVQKCHELKFTNIDWRPADIPSPATADAHSLGWTSVRSEGCTWRDAALGLQFLPTMGDGVFIGDTFENSSFAGSEYARRAILTGTKHYWRTGKPLNARVLIEVSESTDVEIHGAKIVIEAGAVRPPEFAGDGPYGIKCPPSSLVDKTRRVVTNGNFTGAILDDGTKVHSMVRLCSLAEDNVFVGEMSNAMYQVDEMKNNDTSGVL